MSLEERPKDTSSIPVSMREARGPFGADHAFRHAVSLCGIMLPEHERTPELLESTVHSIIERALKDFKEDLKTFGFDLAEPDDQP